MQQEKPMTTDTRPPPPASKAALPKEADMAPIESVTATDFDKTQPYTPDRDLAMAAGEIVTVTLNVQGLGGIADYEVRIELPAFDDHLKAVAQIVYQVHAAAFEVNWPRPDEQGDDS
jgi:hypothetical protein